MISKDQIYINNETGQRVLVLRVDDHYVHYQQDGFIKPLFKYEFLEQFTLEVGDGGNITG
ncbi:hypothetical protein [Psychrobacter aquimaris]|uniref:hypothetical protein n=1 Tax=Psychrobacter aquimaris TaxID=292733 RepID=UPI0039C75A26